ncbi:cytochrome P450 [Akanthomyces lecanii RCEF 1005]|uniref:Cytochrome P450 n=1 Tax=Akanthomyces lecanii RCEF 1005 TaxID=1081108 RepID=A0A168JKA7_CORDF|nr:cytochrome P450 [Akanthomyces lecanii RCEF 1005]
MASASQANFYGYVDREVKRYLMTLLVDPARFHDNARELTGRIMTTLSIDDAAQGARFGAKATETLRQMSISGPIINALTPLYALCDMVGYNPWRTFEEKREGEMRRWWRQNLQVAKKRFLHGSLPENTWSYRYLAQVAAGEGSKGKNPSLEQSSEEEDFAACMLGFQTMVGVVTVAGPIQYFIMAMGLHPEWQKKMQEEIDRVCGDRMPQIGDYEQLPTVRACVKESLRWRSTVPLGVPHRCEEDVEYRGVTIKKDDVVLACEWALNRVPEQYPDPENFRPERWLERGWPTYMEPLSRYPNLREGKGMHTFGWGRRMCLGQSIADHELFIVGASVVWGFSVSVKKCPLTGEEIVFDDQATNSSVILEPTTFPMNLKPRSPGHVKDIMRQYESMQTEMRA